MISGKMTREEAKIFLLQLHTDKQLNKSEHEALRIAIELLGQEPCEDCISRKAVLEIIERETFKANALAKIEKLPPVTPQPKIGHWIEGNSYGDQYNYYQSYVCNCCKCECGDVHGWKYCPYCGAKMKKVNADKDNN